MAGRRAVRTTPVSRQEWDARTSALTAAPTAPPAARAPLTVERIVSAALGVVTEQGYEGLTVRRVASALGTSPSSLYAHVSGTGELGELLVAEACSRVPIPEPDPATWHEQYLGVCHSLRDELLRYPGLARAAMATVPSHPRVLGVAEALLTLLLAGGAAPRAAAWTADATYLHITAHCLEAGARRGQLRDATGAVLDRAEVTARLRALPADRFPSTVRLAEELTAGGENDRLDFALDLLLEGLQAPRGNPPPDDVSR